MNNIYSYFLFTFFLLNIFSYNAGYAQANIELKKTENIENIMQDKIRKLEEEIRCPVCPYQSIAESNADISIELRKIITEKIYKGQSTYKIKMYLVERYGESILFKPMLKPHNYFLWFIGPLTSLIGFFFIYKMRRKQPKQ